MQAYDVLRVSRFRRDLQEAKAEVSAMQRQMAERESAAAAELAASEAALREARQKLRHLEALQPLASGAERPIVLTVCLSAGIHSAPAMSRGV